MVDDEVIICSAWEVIYQSPWKVQHRNWKMNLFKHCRCRGLKWLSSGCDVFFVGVEVPKGDNEGNMLRGLEM